jgi:hypothetical protein
MVHTAMPPLAAVSSQQRRLNFLMPLMLGMPEMVFQIGEMQWMSLIGHLVFGLATATNKGKEVKEYISIKSRQTGQVLAAGTRSRDVQFHEGAWYFDRHKVDMTHLVVRRTAV